MEDKFSEKRDLLIQELLHQGISDINVIDAIRKVPRHLFVKKSDIDLAYSNIPLEIGKGQTISQPYTIAVMLQALGLEKGKIVLEIGACSGYNAALMSVIVGEKGFVYSLEIVHELAETAMKNIAKLKIKNIKVIETDGSLGWEKKAPYDRIIITAACPDIPKPVLDQLKIRGILVAPVGSMYGQRMIRITKTEKGINEEYIGDFSFVPLRGKYGFSSKY